MMMMMMMMMMNTFNYQCSVILGDLLKLTSIQKFGRWQCILATLQSPFQAMEAFHRLEGGSVFAVCGLWTFL